LVTGNYISDWKESLYGLFYKTIIVRKNCNIITIKESVSYTKNNAIKMAKPDIIVVGASAGGVSALTEFVKSLPADLDAAVFIVLHTSPFSPSNLAKILSRSGPLEATHPEDGEKFKKGHIYCASPDHHLILEKEGKIAIKKGPKENRFRPAIDALFRSAALVYGPRVVGIILSGLMDDGTSGMWNIDRCGGRTIVQIAEEAMYPSMPQNVMQYVDVDYVASVTEMGSLLSGITTEKVPERPQLSEHDMELLKMEVVIATHDNAFEMGILNMGELTTFTCPECHGALVSITEGLIIRFRCHTGHAYTTSTLLASVTQSVEEKLWESMRGLEETNLLLKQIGKHYAAAGNKFAANLFLKKAEKIAEHARVVHDSVLAQELFSEDIRFNDNKA
jgi:two-component system chemotaxis response regulator CheB